MRVRQIAGAFAVVSLFAAPTDGPLFTGTEVDDRAVISADGRWMSLTDWSTGDIAIRDLKNGTLERLHAKPGGWESDDVGEYVVLSPDLKQVAYVWREGSNPGHLRVMPNQPGAKPRVLVKNPEFAYILPVAWSTDSKSILVHIWKKDYTAQLAWVSADAGSIQVLRSLEWRLRGRPALSHDGRTVAYAALDPRNSRDSHIYLLRSDGSSEIELVKDSGVNEAPVWTPDGDLLFVSDRSGTRDLYSVGANQPPKLVKTAIGKITPIAITRSGALYYVREQGGEDVFLAGFGAKSGQAVGPVTRLTERAPGLNRGPAWSPDGKSIAFKRRAQGNQAGYDLVVRSLETGMEVTYPSNRLVGVPAHASWLHDGKSLLTAMADRQERISFHRLELATGRFTEVLATDTAYRSLSALSPDDKTLYVTFSDEPAHMAGIAAYDLASGAYRRVYTTKGFVNSFALSPDGKSLAMALSLPQPGHWEGHLAAIGADGNGFRDLYKPQPLPAEQDLFGGGPMLSWSHDGQSILFSEGSRQWRLMRIPAGGGEAQYIGVVTEGLQHDLAVSPDGTRFAFSHGKTAIKETWLLEGLTALSEKTPSPVTDLLAGVPPLGLDAYMPAAEGRIVDEKLGRQLFFDKRLSKDQTISCASCHQPERAFSDGRTVAHGVGDAAGIRNSPALVNRGYGLSFFWDGRAATLEQQVLEPILNPIEMGLSEAELEQRTGMKKAQVAGALASYVRSLRSGNSRYDRFTLGETSALTAVEKQGLEIFRGKGHCVTCHVGPNFTDEQYHNTGVAVHDGRIADQGRFKVTADEKDRGAFKTPTLRELPLTAPYMHDGSIATLEEVVEYYSAGGRANPNLDREMQPRRFTAEEKRALIAFLKTLTQPVSLPAARTP